MGMLDWKHWLVLVLIIVLVFGSKNLKRIGGDLGASIKGFRRAISDDSVEGGAVRPPKDQA